MENLDAMDPADLREFAVVSRNLAEYALTKACAMELRATGDIAGAQTREAQCDAIYKSLPDWARW